MRDMTQTLSTNAPKVHVKSANVEYTENHILAEYSYNSTLVSKKEDGSVTVEPTEQKLTFKTSTKPCKLGYSIGDNLVE